MQNSGSAQPRRKYSSLPELKLDVGGIIPVPLAQTGEGIADCELLRWFVQEVRLTQDILLLSPFLMAQQLRGL